MTKLLKDSGVTVDATTLKLVMDKLKGKSIPQLISEGSSQMVAVGGSCSGASAAGPATTAGPAAKEAPKKEEAKKPAVEEDIDMGNLFGGDDY